ncbi:hypothetical protein EHQ27_06210 [Leptospira wolffii]|uniref:WGR domain-containing protein n=1 Tax=Leptospira wolffii TaxID=409998 RepID=A0A2M9ZHN2_9LEPT|nr:hypothetical protein [Leptospira wolffii]PJZ67836.1 hypothetical protein CH371_01410 [Leptospira wolffii]TGK61763.1 hypothetical protein EHQ32_02605 [Leptospira wolffii]TGK70306.1 hypothetical protein EHQ35_18020 [Leptospira wolffii]TGK74949.1 hypothetical protein EHQ27_06210 [Leptospira wolffii]TGL30918.1 hypothetical protein EHQ57_05790 [Leptospira wolffii]
MQIRLENRTGNRSGRFVVYEYGTDLFGYVYVDKFRGRDKGRIVSRWLMQDVGSLVRLLDHEIYRRESENYENVTIAV